MAEARIPPAGPDGLVTEGRAEGAADYDLRTTLDLVELMAGLDSTVPRAVAATATSVASAIDAIVERLERGGRLIYVGAGSSGRIAALDAWECESTFATAPDQVVAIVAGEGLATAAEQDAAEDDAGAGAAAVEALGVTARDAVVLVSASGSTLFTLGAARAVRAAEALTIAVVSAPGSELAALSDHEVAVVVGPEFVVGSTRLKAGTAQKLVLNQISTIAMIRLGKTYGDLMVDVAGANEKQRARSRRTVALATGATGAEVDAALAAAGGSAKVAIVSLLATIDADEARARLQAAGGRVREALA